MSNEKDKLLDHVYDGIQEYDNALPPWWVYLFVITIIWGIGYLFYYDIFGIEEGKQVQLYEKEVAEFISTMESTGAAENMILDASEVVLVTSPADLNLGERLYIKNCVACHGAKGEGGIGPNLTDNYWIHGGELKDIAMIIYNGVPEKGMTTWRGILNKEEIIALASYVWSLHGTSPPNAKEAQGQEYSRD